MNSFTRLANTDIGPLKLVYDNEFGTGVYSLTTDAPLVKAVELVEYVMGVGVYTATINADIVTVTDERENVDTLSYTGGVLSFGPWLLSPEEVEDFGDIVE